MQKKKGGRMEEGKSAFSGGTKVTFDTTGTYSSGPVNRTNATQNPTTYAAQVNNNNNHIKNNPENKKNIKTFLIAFCGALLACILVLTFSSIFGSCSKTTIGSVNSSAIDKADDSDTLAEAVSAKCLPSVVSINVYAASSKSLSSGSNLTLASMGSGVIISAEGHIITNQHVINGAQQIKVTANGQTYEAEKVGEDTSSDVAVIKLKNAKDLQPVEIANSDKIKIGEWVMAIGCPFGLEQSVSTGIVSATSRSQVVSSQDDGTTKVYTNLIQTDAAINPGNSGGALVDKNGQLIGINALIQSSSGNYSGVGFAIPVNYAIDLSKQIIEGKTPTHAQLGVSMTNVDAKNAKQYGWSVNSGAYVSGVQEGSAAANAGIKVGDIIVKFDDKDISSTNDLLLAVRSHNPGDKVSITVNRSGEEKTFEVTLGSDEGKQQQQQSQKQKGSSSADEFEDLLRKYFGY